MCTTALNGDEWSASHPQRFTSKESAWAGLATVEKTEILPQKLNKSTSLFKSCLVQPDSISLKLLKQFPCIMYSHLPIKKLAFFHVCSLGFANCASSAFHLSVLLSMLSAHM